ncbi:MAG: hypothetical protein NVSMB1_24730 [Polyangiales bacterium]
MVATIERRDGQLHGSIELVSKDGTTRVQRLVSKTNDCTELSSSMTLAISIAIDPMSSIRPLPPPPSPKAIAPTTAPEQVVRANAASPAPPPDVASVASVSSSASHDDPSARSNPIGLQLGIGGLLALGAEPKSTAGVSALIALSWRSLRLQLEGRFDLPTTLSSPEGSVSTSLFVSTLSPCFRYGAALNPDFGILACGLLSVGTLRGAGDNVDIRRSDATLYAASGVRLAFELAIVKGLFARLQADGYVTLRPTTLTLDHVDVWTTPRTSFAPALLLVGQLL